MSDGVLSKESLKILVGSMAVQGSPPDQMVVSGSVLNNREARLMLGLKIPWHMMVEEDCQYIEIEEFGV
jgi:hypothetical protein